MNLQQAAANTTMLSSVPISYPNRTYEHIVNLLSLMHIHLYYHFKHKSTSYIIQKKTPIIIQYSFLSKYYVSRP